MSEIHVLRGATFKREYRWGRAPYIYKAISGIAKSAPARLTVTGHGLPNNWRGAIVGAAGMTEINSLTNPPVETDYHKLTVVDANTIDINDINSIPYGTYVGGSGVLVALTPVPLTGMKARFVMVPDAPNDPNGFTITEQTGITIDTSGFVINLMIDAKHTGNGPELTGKFKLEMIDTSGVVTRLDSGIYKVTEY